MQLHLEPDLAIPFPTEPMPFKDFQEKAAAACRTAELLELDISPTAEDREIAEQALYDIAEDQEKANKVLSKQNFKPAIYHEVNGLLNQYSVRVVESAAQIRLLVTNKLILEAENPDPKYRLRALELLGKITDVGLFTEKSEVTVNHRSTTELVDSIRGKIQKLMYPDDVKDGELVVNGETIDIDAELGLTNASNSN